MRVVLVTRTGKLILADWFKHRELVRLGYDVKVINHSIVEAKDFDPEPAFVLTGKPATSCVQAIRKFTKAPIVLWHQDWTDWTDERRAWSDATLPLVDHVFVCETDVVKRYGHAKFLMSGLNYSEPPTLTPISTSSRTVFAGNLMPTDCDPVRRKIVRQLEPRVVVGEPVRQWRKLGFNVEQPVEQPSMHKVYNGHVGIAFQRRPEMQDCMSNRSLLIAGGGGLLYGQRFRDYEQFISEDEAIWFDKPQPYQYSPAHIEVQQRGFERVWRDYSWPVVMTRMLKEIGHEHPAPG